MKILTLTEESKTDILENLLKRSPNSYGKFESQVAEIIENVRAKTLHYLTIPDVLTVPTSVPIPF